jgi:hypothetical protein
MTQKKKENELDPNTQLEKPTFATSFFAAAQLPQSGHWNRCAAY